LSSSQAKRGDPAIATPGVAAPSASRTVKDSTMLATASIAGLLRSAKKKQRTKYLIYNGYVVH
jgi:hypothetical protein